MRFTPQNRSLDWLIRRPIAHRGLHNEASGVIENTSSAFARAIGHGYAIECDVQLTGDREAVVFHDKTLDHLTEGAGLLTRHTTAQLKSVRFKKGSDTIQTLPELLDQVSGQVPLIVEIKSHWDSNPELTLRIIECTKDYSGPLALMSFDPDVLTVLNNSASHLTRGIVADRVHDSTLSLQRRHDLRLFAHLATTRPHFVSYDFTGLPFQPVQQIRAQGFPVITWTIKSSEDATRARRYSDQITFENYLPE